MKKFAFPIIVIIFVFCLFFKNILFEGKTLLPYRAEMYPGQQKKQFPSVSFSVMDDIASAWVDVPYSFLNNYLIKNRKLPLWNPYSGAGNPLAADQESSVFFPLHLPSLFGIGFWDLYLMLRPIIALLFLFLFLKELGISTLASILGGFLYSFTGYFSFFINVFSLNVDMLIPLGLYSIEKFTKKRSLIRWIFVVFTYFLILNAGNPQNAIITLFFLNAYFVIRSIFYKHSSGKNIKILMFLLLTNIVSLSLSAYNYLPFIELFRNAFHVHLKGTSLIHMNATTLFNFIYPYSIGYLRGQLFNEIGWLRAIPYFGIIGSWLALIGLSTKKFRMHSIFFGVVVLVWLMKHFGLGILNPILNLPIITHIWFNKYVSTMFISASILAALGFQTILDFRYQTKKAHIHIIFFSISAFIILMVGYFISNKVGLDLRQNITPFFIGIGSIINSLHNYKDIGGQFVKREILLIYFVIIYCATLLLLRLRSNKNIFNICKFVGSIILFFLIILETYLYFPKIKYNKFDPAKTFPFVDFIKKDKSIFRIYGVRQTLMPNENIYHLLNDIRMVSPLLVERYSTFFKKILGEPVPNNLGSFLGVPDGTMKKIRNDFLSFLNVKYVLSEKYIYDDSYKLIYNQELKIYKNNNFQPRARLIYNVSRVNNKDEALNKIKKPSFNPLTQAVVEGIAPDYFKSNVKEKIDNKVEISKYEADKVELNLYTEKPGLLVLSDTFYPGWEAYVDGIKTEIHPANYAFRGVFVRQGSHRVIFHYNPLSFKIGLTISTITLSSLVYLFLIRKKYVKSE